MNVSDYDYHLPTDRIAQHPPKVRGSSRLLTLNKATGHIENRMYRDLPLLLNQGDVVIINDTKVIKARLMTQNEAGKNRELLLLEKHAGDDDWHVHKALHRGTVRPQETLMVAGIEIEVSSIVGDGIVELRCKRDLQEVAEKHGSVPLPPYMKRNASPEDVRRYQTEFAKQAGSVAAPTASLNLTQDILAQLRTKGVVVETMTLHVGMGTFLPIRSDSLEQHKMHKEYFEIPLSTARAIRTAKEDGKRVIPIGTTVTRALEYSAQDILKGSTQVLTGEADIFIYPGYQFKLVDALVTNFHAPRSTVLMMAAALAGWSHLKKAYKEAVENNYAFLSYGDSMFIY